jgi:cobalt/nickel transport system permease protein
MPVVCLKDVLFWYKNFSFGFTFGVYLSAREQIGFFIVKISENKMWIDYYAQNSGMRNWNSKYKVLLALITICLVVALDNIAVSVFVLITMSALTLSAGKTPTKIYISLMMIPFTFIILSGITIMVQFSNAGEGVGFVTKYFCIYVSRESVYTALSVCFKALGAVSAMYMMSLSTPLGEIISVLRSFHLPKIIVELMNLIYRYIFILLECAGQMQSASKARLGDKNFATACRSFSSIACNLFIVSMQKANRYYDALVSRGYDGGLIFMTRKSKVNIWQIALLCVYVFVIVILKFFCRV